MIVTSLIANFDENLRRFFIFINFVLTKKFNDNTMYRGISVQIAFYR